MLPDFSAWLPTTFDGWMTLGVLSSLGMAAVLGGIVVWGLLWPARNKARRGF